jgi:replication factor A1
MGGGRRRGRNHSRFESKALEYLATLAAKHDISTKELLDAVVYAWNNGRTRCGELAIQCRRKMNGYAIFLITSDYTVVAQFPISENVLHGKCSVERFDYKWKSVREAIEKRERSGYSEHMRIVDLKSGMKGVRMSAQVIEISKPKLLLTRLNDYALLVNATLSDETGTITLPLWNDRTRGISVNDTLQIENARVTTFQGERQLRIGKRGILKVLKEDPCQVNRPLVKYVMGRVGAKRNAN